MDLAMWQKFSGSSPLDLASKAGGPIDAHCCHMHFMWQVNVLNYQG